MIELQDKRLQRRQQQHEEDWCYQSQKDSSINNDLVQQKHQQQQQTPRPELRKVQALQGERSLVFVLPKSIAVELGIEKGDYLSVRVEQPRKIVLQKAEV